MSKPKYLFVHDWRTHQSYRADRGMPPWIKIHRELIRNEKWLSLSEGERGQLISIWLLAADNDGRVINDAGIIRRACGLDNDPDINKLISLGLLDAKLTPKRRQVDANVTTINAKLDAPEAETETETETEAEKKESSSLSVGKRPHYPPAFDEFWELYPRKIGKGAALKAWLNAVKKAPTSTIIAGLQSQLPYLAEQYRGKGEDFRPHPSTWLNGGRWADEVDEPLSTEQKVHAALREKAKREDEEYARKQAGNTGTGFKSLADILPVALDAPDSPGRIRGNGVDSGRRDMGREFYARDVAGGDD